MKDPSARLKIGLLSLVSAILFVILVMSLSDVSFTPQREIRVDFGNINGLELHAPVRYAGARVGEVKRVHILTAKERAAFPKNPPAVYVYANVDRDLEVTQGSKGMVNTLGFMGEKYLELLCNTTSTTYIADNEPLQGIDPTPMDTVFASAKLLSDDLRVTATNVNIVAVDLQKRLPSINHELDLTLSSTRRFTDNANDVLEANRDDLRHLIENARQSTIYFKSMTHVLATRPWKLIWGFFGGPIPIEPENAPPAPTGAPKKKDYPKDDRNRNRSR